MRLFVHGAAATPTTLLEALARRTDLEGVTVYHLHTAGPAPFAAPEQAGDAVQEGGRDAVGLAELVPERNRDIGLARRAPRARPV